MRGLTFRLSGAMALVACWLSVVVYGEPIRVRYLQGALHGFLTVKTLQGEAIATGEVMQVVRGDQVTTRVLLRFRDGSVDDEVTVFTQRGTLHLVSDHHVQHGPTFPRPIDVLVKTATGQVISRTEDGKVEEEHMDLPEDLANGLPPNLLFNIPASIAETKISYLVAGSKLRLIHFSIKRTGSVPVTIGGLRRTATDYTMHAELGGIAGVVAPLVGKEPDDIHMWIMPGDPPLLVREEGQLFEGGPVWRIEQIAASLEKSQ